MAEGKPNYTLKLLLNPFNIYMFFAVAAFGLITGNFIVLPFAAGIEALVLLAVPRTRVFRRHVDEGVAEIESARSRRSLDSLASVMVEAHRKEFERLLELGASIRTLPGVSMVDVEVVAGLVAEYASLAAKYKASLAPLAYDDKSKILEDISSLEAILAGYSNAGRSQTAALREVIGKRLAIAKARLERWDAGRLVLEETAHRMAACIETAKLMLASAADPPPRLAEGDAVGEALDRIGASDEVRAELAEFNRED